MKNIKLTAEEMVIVDRLKQMKMSGMAQAYEEQIQNPNADLSSFYERFSNIVNYDFASTKNSTVFLRKQLLGIHRQHLMTRYTIQTECWTPKPLNGLRLAHGLMKEEIFLSQVPPVRGNLIYQTHYALLQSDSLEQSNISVQTP